MSTRLVTLKNPSDSTETLYPQTSDTAVKRTGGSTVKASLDALETNLQNEATARANADAALQANINAVSGNVSTLTTNLQTEVTTRQANVDSINTALEDGVLALSADPTSVFLPAITGNESDTSHGATTSAIATYVQEQDNLIQSQVDDLSGTTGQIANIVGGVPFEQDIDITTGAVWTDGKSVFADGIYIGNPSDSTGNSIIELNISDYQGKTLHFSQRVMDSNAAQTGSIFYSGTNNSTYIEGSGMVDPTGAVSVNQYQDKVVTIPLNAERLRCTFWTAEKSHFYAYVKDTIATNGLQKDVQDLQDEMTSLDESVDDLSWDVNGDIKSGSTQETQQYLIENGTLNIPTGTKFYWRWSTTAQYDRIIIYCNTDTNEQGRLVDTNVSTPTMNTWHEETALVNINRIGTYITNATAPIYFEIATNFGKAEYTHTHEISDVDGLQTAVDSISTLQGEVQELSEEVSEISENVTCINLVNKNDSDVQSGKFMSSKIQSNGSYFLSAPIPVTEGQTYTFSNNGSSAQMRFVAFLTSRDATTSTNYTENITSFLVPSGFSYVRISVINTTWNGNPQLEKGSTVSPYVEYFEDYAQVKLRDKQVTKAKLADDINLGDVTFKSFQASGALANGETLETAKVHIRKNTTLVAKISGTLEDVLIGCGYHDYMGYWLEITSTQVKTYWYNNTADTLIATYSHGLTLDDYTMVKIDCNSETSGMCSVRIMTGEGQSYDLEVSLWGYGKPFVTNNGSSSINASLSFFPKDISKHVWLFGDSYFSYEASNRWPYYLVSDEYKGYLMNAQSGLSPASAYSDLQNLLTLGFKPTYLVWCLGMNGNTSESKVNGQYVINSYQKQYIDSVKTLCDNNGIELVLATIPTVPSRQKTGFNIYVKSLDVRYIDFADAVGADEYGIWHRKPTLRAWANSGNRVYTQMMGNGHDTVEVNDKVFDASGNYTSYQVTAVGESFSTITVNGTIYTRNAENDLEGLLSSDGVHPTVIGAKVLCSRALLDFSEMTIDE